MEFSYRITQDQYLRAKRLVIGPSIWPWLRRRLLVGFALVFCAAVLISIVLHNSPPMNSQQDTRPAQEAVQLNGWAATIPWILCIAVFGISVFSLVASGPLRDRRTFKNDPLMHGEITVNLTSELISTHNTAGATSQFAWSAFERWLERKDMVLLVMRSRGYIILGVSSLTDVQRAELRGILSIALPRK
jgi:hypothetical protein